jgi:hypothetical protein
MQLIVLFFLCHITTSSRTGTMKPIFHLFLLLALITAACNPGDAATPIRAQWLKEPSQQPTHTSANPLLQWWSALTTRHPSTPTAAVTKAPAECIWQDFPTHDALKAWEFQAQPRRHVVSQPMRAEHPTVCTVTTAVQLRQHAHSTPCAT